VILLSAEDGLADTIRPRIDALGGNPKLISALQAVKPTGEEQHFSLARDLPALTKAIQAVGAVLVIIDPLSAYLGGTDSFKDAELRELLAPLASIADAFGTAVIGVMHLNKDAEKAAIYRVGGSIAFVGTARASFVVVKDRKNADRRIFLPVKFNLGPMPLGLAFRISEERVEWEPDPVLVEADALLRHVSRQSEGDDDREMAGEREEAKAFLQAFLADGPALANDVMSQARKLGIAERTLQRAKTALGVASRKLQGIAGGGAWVWEIGKVANRGGKDATM
jgi:hypothetical protein